MSAVEEYRKSMLGPNAFCHKRLVDAAIAELEAERDALRDAMQTLIDYTDEFTSGQSVKTRQRLGMAQAYAGTVLRGGDPMEAVCAEWSDSSGLVTHFTPSCWSRGKKP
jgi:hypothetical protein